MSDPLRALRERITENDRAIVAAMNTRLRLVAALWEVKRQIGAEQLDPERERSLRAELHATNGGPLSPAGLDLLVDELLALTRRELDGDSAS